MQNLNSKIIAVVLSLTLIIVNTRISYSEFGRRRHFLSHGSSVTSFGTGESVFSAYDDPASLQYNPSLMVFFPVNAVSFSRFNLFEGSSHNSISAVFGAEKKAFIGISASNLSSGNVELRKDIFSNPEKVNSVNTWDFVVAASCFINFLNVACGFSAKCLPRDLNFKNGTYAIDGGLSKIIDFGNVLKVKLGISAQNFTVSRLNNGDGREDGIPIIYRLSFAFIFPVCNRFKSKDTINIYADLKREDGYTNFCGGLAYIIADKYTLCAGYYPEHFTFGIGISFYSFILNYAADFGNMGLINRFGLTYKWNFKKSDEFSDELSKEAYDALNKREMNFKNAEKKFVEAKRLYDNKEYLRATDMLSAIVMSCPDYELPRDLYEKIAKMMKETAYSTNESDFGKLTYAKAYVAYYDANYKEALNEWKKNIGFVGGTEEIKDYSKKIDTILKLEKLEEREKKLDMQAREMLKRGIEKYNLRKWLQCVKEMEELEKFVSSNNFSKTLEYCNKAREYIGKSVAELSKSLSVKNKTTSQSEGQQEEKVEYDEASADKKYAEGLVLYAQGKYYEAERAWELTLRFNPRHHKANIALRKLKNSMTNSSITATD
ncbi:MAG: hypothetical protein LE169_01365 [Endomicrobium sp.]|nr:hypothetical protein [Endomicrobium sp.]